ncbi:MAG TPA: hypothetical protein VGK37_11195 [Casimicrobiaceae bacterium]|jgi:hypothetical protein
MKRLILFLLAATTLGGCVVVPYDAYYDGHRHYYGRYYDRDYRYRGDHY